MRDFFKGWRRKVGCATLVMALLLYAMWMRSRVIGDSLMFPTIGNWYEGLNSGNQCIVWKRYRFEEPYDYYHSAYYRFVPADWLNSSYFSWKWRFGQFGVAENRNDSMTCAVFPYWSVALPLTLLSAYLILWKPRKKDQPDA